MIQFSICQVQAMNVVLFLLPALVTPVFGQLKWENPEQSFTPRPLDKFIDANFRFTNIGNTPVKITDLRPSCGCTTATLQKKEYAPGESGEIAARFKFDGRIGRQEKWIVVTTDWVPPQPTILRMAVNIPEAITIRPELVVWRVGDELKPKTIRIAVPEEIPAKIVSVQADNPAVKLELHEVRPGKEVEVKVTPASTSGPGSATLLIRTDYPPENPATHYAYARVK
ncbi:MAG: DUF1573 domain-containing protein [Chthoniobacterales bacterium]